MAQSKVTNLCGASEEFNAMQNRFDDLISDALSSLEDEASTLAALLGDAFDLLLTDIRALMPELPDLPNVNLQSLVTSLSSLTEGTSEYATLLADIKSNFGEDLASLGFDLDALIPDALTEILGGGDGCSVIPNVIKAADKLTSAYEIARNSPFPLNLSQSEEAATIVKNSVLVAGRGVVINRVEKIIIEASTAVDVVSGTVTSTKIPATDTGVFTVTKESEEVTYTSTTVISGGGSTVTTRAKEVTPPNKQKGKNLTHSGGFTRIKVTEIQEFGEDDLELGIAFDGHVHMLELKSEPIGGLLIYANIKVTRNGKTYDSDGNRIPGFHPVKHQRMIQCHDGADIGKVGNVPRSHQLNYGRKNPYYTVEGKTVTVFENGNVIFDHVQDPELRGYKKRYDGVAILVKNRIFGEYDASKTDKLE